MVAHPPSKRRPTRVNGEQTRRKILDAAEQLFSVRGFAAVSLRDITQGADVTLALASYHYGTKENLFEEVVARRAAVLSELRCTRLDALVTRDVRAIMDAFMAPLFELSETDDAGWLAYFRLLPQLTDNAQWTDLLARYFDDTARRFIDALCAVLDGAERANVARAFTMSLQVMLATASQSKRIDKLTGGAVSGADLASAYPALLDYVTAGLYSTAPRA